ncbi:hypothetical protein QVD17_11948 [Tagetes erecta]|uniref:Uncharacterized protein n=1 Tax=Tagetes erecta TaxID=13708 RepID=A0AAD8L1P0_TARER|nr:hypothetical protein QVD17_11948 [Tagetes erecta]
MPVIAIYKIKQDLQVISEPLCSIQLSFQAILIVCGDFTSQIHSAQISEKDLEEMDLRAMITLREKWFMDIHGRQSMGVKKNLGLDMSKDRC